ncbi:MAG: DUF5691 domain-containing protein [Haliscomenobacter sp.]|uniref:DUF5691 domain-containing protein n=1 Tax=Haliscomenobacter sp. TaxID=2717303 RepID=UPI0029AEB11C|nr:DUF5691 domain-containing protein [Haliscomenobacter sp.]MDX2068340.1 DUF5691 domain-containing protein [Haliscomenobacter sp.]
MKHLEELQTLLLLGTDQTPLGEELLQYLQAEGVALTDLPENSAGMAMVYFRQWRRAGFSLEEWKGELPVTENYTQSELECSAASARCLQEILGGKYSDALGEWVNLLLQAQQVLPREALPALFQRSLSDPELWETIRVAIGSRGKWLLLQNPVWQPLWETSPKTDWNTSTGAARLALLRSIRKHDPALGLKELQSSWETEDPGQKAALLAELNQGLSLQDETFLEHCLQDRRKETRQVAAELLARIPNSGLFQRYLGYLQACVEVKDNKVILNLPSEAPETWRKDGVEMGGKAPFSFTQRSAWVFQLMRRLPPQYWQSEWGLAPLQAIHLFAQQDREESWVQALTDASLLHHDLVWQAALAEWWLNQPGASSWQTTPGRHLLQMLPGDSLQQLLLPFLQKQSYLLEEDHVATYLLCANPQPWSEELSMAVLQPFKRYLAGADNPFWNIWHYTRILKALAYHCPPGLYATLNGGWNVDSPLWQRWQGEVERMLAVLQFRAKMQQTFQQTA